MEFSESGENYNSTVERIRPLVLKRYGGDVNFARKNENGEDVLWTFDQAMQRCAKYLIGESDADIIATKDRSGMRGSSTGSS
ncbi:hypothetical protein A2707_03400 [Candidatus Saccharibacteria bacterium RIFCSPHIGHO2_01_FULL_45_15]|nr:MAG: hypothetical protein A2707_03400 [Candidatus Saccharibacteria bacterium RIFCSPHIGHO2_01_FULL_45_15]OGL27263.1 MAG: hypothetical protein A3C39_04590 [Candidatus Saccharibacteria bacterium RIFCSPHIGHO2_02_FULL_46_12]OGL32456.1 MAG: hypothetical protein A3E76_00170 [Candidatus Saccharibacteria bacterium RIFCSPHIGHO2_12_FULL_44_22]